MMVAHLSDIDPQGLRIADSGHVFIEAAELFFDRANDGFGQSHFLAANVDV